MRATYEEVKIEMAGNFAFNPVGEDSARQIDLGEIVEAKNAVVVSFGSGREGMQAAAAGVAEDGIQGREALEGFRHDSVQRSGIRNIGLENKYRTEAGFSSHPAFAGLTSSGLISSRIRVAPAADSFRTMDSAIAPSAPVIKIDFAGQVDIDHLL